MTTMPHDLFTVWRADEVAECLPGVPDHLYRKLWDTIVPLQGKAEVSDGSWNLAEYWSKLSDDDHILLNQLAAKHVAGIRMDLTETEYHRENYFSQSSKSIHQSTPPLRRPKLKPTGKEPTLH